MTNIDNNARAVAIILTAVFCAMWAAIIGSYNPFNGDSYPVEIIESSHISLYDDNTDSSLEGAIFQTSEGGKESFKISAHYHLGEKSAGGVFISFSGENLDASFTGTLNGMPIKNYSYVWPDYLELGAYYFRMTSDSGEGDFYLECSSTHSKDVQIHNVVIGIGTYYGKPGSIVLAPESVAFPFECIEGC